MEVIIIVKKNDILEVTVTDVTASGDGVAKYQDYPLFIKGGVTEDILSVTVTKTNKTYGFGRINKIVKPSPHRTKAPCPVFESCGGCDLMHIAYPHQICIKENIIKGNLQRIGALRPCDYEFEGVIDARNTQSYRNKAQLPIGRKGKTTVVGFYSKKSHEIVPVSECMIQDDKINSLTALFVDYANRHKISVYNENTHKGILRHLYIRTGNKTGEILFTVVTNSASPLPFEDELINILQTQSGLKGIIQNINTKRTNLILGDKSRVLWGQDKICSMIDNLRFNISSESFFQVNGEQTAKLYSKALEYACPEENETVFDLYCGTGSISLFLAQKAQRVIGVEIVEKAIENAKENAKLNNISNVSFFAGDCAKVVEKLISQGEKADIVVVDPPRKGCSEDMLSLINDMSPKKLVYVSCNSATLARDVKILRDYGYTLKKVCGVDMFPHSGHVECCALLCRTQHSSI